MKLLTLAATALIAATTLFVPEAGARPNRTYCNALDDGTEFCVAPVGRIDVHVTVDNKRDGTGFMAHGDCTTGDVQWKNNEGWTNENIIETVRFLCNN
jgi:hypothetical protein